MSAYRTVVLELEVLLDSSDGQASAWTRALRDAGHEVTFADLRERMGMGSALLLSELTGLPPDSPAAARIHADRRNLFQALHLRNVNVLPGARDLLARLRREGHTVVLTSSTESDDRVALALLDHAQLRGTFDELVCLPEGSRAKPSPDIVQAALEAADTRADEALLIGDTPYDLAAARAAGVASIALESGGWPAIALGGAVAVYRHPLDLLSNFEMSPLSRASSSFEPAWLQAGPSSSAQFL